MAILLLSQQQAIKPISQNWALGIKITGGVTNYEQLAEEVEGKELRTLLGIDFLQWVQNNQTDPNVIFILDPFDFENINLNTVTCRGLKFILAYLNYVKYIGESYITDTATGFVKKNRNESDNLDRGEIERLQREYREIALQEFDLLREFLDLNYDTYTIWPYRKKQKLGLPKIQGLRRTSRKNEIQVNKILIVKTE